MASTTPSQSLLTEGLQNFKIPRGAHQPILMPHSSPGTKNYPPARAIRVPHPNPGTQYQQPPPPPPPPLPQKQQIQLTSTSKHISFGVLPTRDRVSPSHATSSPIPIPGATKWYDLELLDPGTNLPWDWVHGPARVHYWSDNVVQYFRLGTCGWEPWQTVYVEGRERGVGKILRGGRPEMWPAMEKAYRREVEVERPAKSGRPDDENKGGEDKDQEGEGEEGQWKDDVKEEDGDEADEEKHDGTEEDVTEQQDNENDPMETWRQHLAKLYTKKYATSECAADEEACESSSPLSPSPLSSSDPCATNNDSAPEPEGFPHDAAPERHDGRLYCDRTSASSTSTLYSTYSSCGSTPASSEDDDNDSKTDPWESGHEDDRCGYAYATSKYDVEESCDAEVDDDRYELEDDMVPGRIC